VKGIRDATSDEEVSAFWKMTDEEVERRLVVHVMAEIACGHGQLIKIGQQRCVGVVDPGHQQLGDLPGRRSMGVVCMTGIGTC
jgi:hypothetical protein